MLSIDIKKSTEESGLDQFTAVFQGVTIEKGENGKVSKEMILKGLASNPAKDSDGEYLMPSGFQIDPFMKSGTINWNHQTNKDPLSVIGRPTVGTEVVKGKEEFVVAAKLWKGHPRAEQVYNLAQIMEKNGDALAFSIEGSVIERDSTNPKIVTKAMITGVAITPNPKNAESNISVIKSLAADGVEGMEDLCKSYTDYLEISKSMTATHSQGGEKDAGTTEGSALKNEALEGAKTEETEEDKKKRLKKEAIKDDVTYTTKSQIGVRLEKLLPNASEENIEKIVNYIIKSNTSMSLEKTDAEISKALSTLGLGSDAPEVVAEVVPEVVSETVNLETASDNELFKALSDRGFNVEVEIGRAHV